LEIGDTADREVCQNGKEPMWPFKRKNRAFERRHVLDVKIARRQAVRYRVRVATLAASLSLGTIFAIYLLWRIGDWSMTRFIYENKAFAIQKKIEPATEIVRGSYGTKQFWRFPHRYKYAAWLLGKVPNPYARLPRTAFADEEVLELRDALIQSGLKVVREPAECKNLGMATY